MFDFDGLEKDQDKSTLEVVAIFAVCEARWKEMGLEMDLFQADLVEDLESLKTWKAKELTAECQRQGRFRFVGFFFERKGGIAITSEKSELVQALRKVRLWRALPQEKLKEILKERRRDKDTEELFVP
eukprot:symbB.v1.2.011336.t1/scaffold758.1/size305206/2